MSYADDLVAIGVQIAITRERLETLIQRAHETIPLVIAAGHSEREIARMLGVDRMTVRSWQGKRKRKRQS